MLAFDVRQLHIQQQQQQHGDDEMLVSTPDSSRTDSPKNMVCTDDDVDAALDDLQMTLTGEEAESPRTSFLNKCPELRGYLLVYQ